MSVKSEDVEQPLHDPVGKVPQSTNPCFHSIAWTKVLAETYGYQPCHFSLNIKGKTVSSIPFMEIDSWLTGKRGVSLPFIDFCDTFVDESIPIGEMIDNLIKYGRNAGWRYFEIRPNYVLPEKYLPSKIYYGHVLDIGRSPERIFAGFHDSTRGNVRKAQKLDVRVSFDNSWESVQEFYRLQCITRRRHGLPPQPIDFFKNIFKHILSEGLGVTALAKYDGQCIAGSIFFHWGTRALFKYNASDKAFQFLRPNNLIIWEAIQLYHSIGCEEFYFGRTELENAGLSRFKVDWGARQYLLHYYKYDLLLNSFVKDTFKPVGAYNIIFSRMPVWMLKGAGSAMYKHFA